MRGIPGTDVSKKFLEKKKAILANGGWPVSKWILFCEQLLARGYHVVVYEAKTTRSKYVYVVRGQRQFKVRFSNHRPSFDRQIQSDSDFYVGVSHGLVTTTDDALKAVEEFFATAVVQ